MIVHPILQLILYLHKQLTRFYEKSLIFVIDLSVSTKAVLSPWES